MSVWGVSVNVRSVWGVCVSSVCLRSVSLRSVWGVSVSMSVSLRSVRGVWSVSVSLLIYRVSNQFENSF